MTCLLPLILFAGTLAPCSLEAAASGIPRVPKTRLTVDGNLDDWTGIAWFPLVQTPTGAAFVPSADLDVKVAFAFDSERFYVAVSAVDDQFETVDRGWRYGDGFYWTLVNDEGPASTYQVQFGFARGQKTLVYKNGAYYLRPAAAGVAFQFAQDGHRCLYEVAIPFDLLKPFEPFVHRTRPFNLVYVDRDGGRVEDVVALAPDADYDTESTALRRGRPFQLIPGPASATAEAGSHWSIARNFFRAGTTIRVDHTLDFPKDVAGARLRVSIADGSRVVEETMQSLSLGKGLRPGTSTLRIGEVPSGAYELRGRVEDGRGREIAAYREEVFILNEGELVRLRAELEPYRRRPRLAPSLPNLEVRFEWFVDFYKGSGYENIRPLASWLDEIRLLGRRLQAGEPALFEPGQVRRLAHRSRIDGTLQPYSVFLPADFASDRRYPLVVGLHGSGVDESNVIDGFSARLRTLGYPVLAPRARGLSDFYLGDSGADVFECIEHFLALYPNVDASRVYVLGFSMGGYGAWRLGLLRPGYFKGLIIMSGALAPRRRTGGENILDLLDRARGQHLLIVHGAKDDAVPIDQTRRAVERLKATGVDVEYIELPEASHGNYDRWADVVDWIRRREKEESAGRDRLGSHVHHPSPR